MSRAQSCRFLSISPRLRAGAFLPRPMRRCSDRGFSAIDVLEKSPVRGQILTRYNEHFGPWAGLALGLLIFERLLSLGRLRRLP